MRTLTTVQRLTSAALFSILLLLAAFTTGCDAHGPAFADSEAPASRVGDDGRAGGDDGFVDPQDATTFYAMSISETSTSGQGGPASIDPDTNPDRDDEGEYVIEGYANESIERGETLEVLNRRGEFQFYGLVEEVGFTIQRGDTYEARVVVQEINF